MTSVLTSVTDQETSHDTVAMHDGSTSGELRYNEVNVHSGVICPNAFSIRRSIPQVTHFLDDFSFVGPANDPVCQHVLLTFESLPTSLDIALNNENKCPMLNDILRFGRSSSDVGTLWCDKHACIGLLYQSYECKTVTMFVRNERNQFEHNRTCQYPPSGYFVE